MGKLLTTKKGKRLYQDDNGIIYETTIGKTYGRSLDKFRHGKYVYRTYKLPAAIKGNNVSIKTYDEESAKQILKLSGIPKSKAQIQREKARAERMKNAPDLNKPIKIGNFEYKSNINIPKRSDLTTKKNSNTNKSTTTNQNKSTKQNAKTPENNYVMRRDNSTTTQPKNSTTTQSKTTKQNTVKHTNTSSTVTPKRSSSRISSSTPNGNYTVNRGDSLWRIAHNAGISLNELMRQNPQIKSINQVIHPGDKINVNGNRNSNNTNIPTQSTNTSTPATSTLNYDNIILDDSKMQTNINTTPSQEQLNVPNKLEPIKYNYKKKKR